MTLPDFVSRFRVEFAPAVEVQQLSREFQDLCHTPKTMVEITAEFRERQRVRESYIGSTLCCRQGDEDELVPR